MNIMYLNKQDASLLYNLFKMNLGDRFLGSRLGMVWAIASPLMMLSIFTFVFGFVFKSKLPGAETTLAYVIWLISGYGPWLAITEGLMSGTTSVVANTSIVKNLSFKTEILPVSGALMGLVPLLVALVFLAVLIVIDGRSPSLSWLFIVPAILFQFIFMIGISFFLATLNVFIRDISTALPNLLLLLLFFSPIFYPLSAFPMVLQEIFAFNPFYIMTEMYRQPLLYNQLPDVWPVIYFVLLSSLLCFFGLKVFRRGKQFFDSCM